MMKETLLRMKSLFAGRWTGEGFARFPGIENSGYTEQLEFIADEYKDALFYQQKTWYKNNRENNGQTVFWDSGFIFLKQDQILLNSVQVGGRIEAYELLKAAGDLFTFNSLSILNDPKAIRSQRIFTVNADSLHYEMNMATHTAGFQNHLLADLKKSP